MAAQGQNGARPRLPIVVNLVAYRGDTWYQTFRLRYDDQPVDLIGTTIQSSAYHRDKALLVSLSVVTDPDPGVIILSLPLDIPFGAYTYDVEVVDAAGEVTTWVRGKLQVEKDVTNAL